MYDGEQSTSGMIYGAKSERDIQTFTLLRPTGAVALSGIKFLAVVLLAFIAKF